MTEIEKQAADPSTVSTAYRIMTPRWDKMRSLLGGTEAMRLAGKTYLPQHAAEKENAYNERLARATLYNVTELTLESWVGRPFSEPIRNSEDMPEQIAMLTEDIDMQGNDLTVFARTWFRDGLAKAFSHVMIDMPRKQPKPDGMPRTLADDRAENLRPYWVHIPPENLIFAHSEVVNGVEKLTHVRIMETDSVRIGFTETFVRRIRVLEPGIVRIYEEQDVRGRKKKEWVLVEEFATDINFVPIVTFYANREDFMLGKSPLSDLADLNISHWQGSSDQTSILTVARFPMLALSGGVDEKGTLEVGPRKWLWTPDAQGKFYYVEHSGKAIGAGRQDLLDLQEQMAEYGAEFLKKRPGGATATARALDSAEATSPLQDVTRRFIDSVNLALSYTAEWLKMDSGGTVEMVTEFGPETVESADLDALKAARATRDISRETYLFELKRRGVLDEDFDADEDQHELEEETTAFAGIASQDLDPNNPEGNGEAGGNGNGEDEGEGEEGEEEGEEE